MNIKTLFFINLLILYNTLGETKTRKNHLRGINLFKIYENSERRISNKFGDIKFSCFDKEDEGHYVHQDCRKYWHCLYVGTVFEAALERKCPAGTMFHPIQRVCEISSMLNCLSWYKSIYGNDYVPKQTFPDENFNAYTTLQVSNPLIDTSNELSEFLDTFKPENEAITTFELSDNNYEDFETETVEIQTTTPETTSTFTTKTTTTKTRATIRIKTSTTKTTKTTTLLTTTIPTTILTTITTTTARTSTTKKTTTPTTTKTTTIKTTKKLLTTRITTKSTTVLSTTTTISSRHKLDESYDLEEDDEDSEVIDDNEYNYDDNTNYDGYDDDYSEFPPLTGSYKIQINTTKESITDALSPKITETTRLTSKFTTLFSSNLLEKLRNFESNEKLNEKNNSINLKNFTILSSNGKKIFMADSESSTATKQTTNSIRILVTKSNGSSIVEPVQIIKNVFAINNRTNGNGYMPNLSSKIFLTEQMYAKTAATTRSIQTTTDQVQSYYEDIQPAEEEEIEGEEIMNEEINESDNAGQDNDLLLNLQLNTDTGNKTQTTEYENYPDENSGNFLYADKATSSALKPSLLNLDKLFFISILNFYLQILF